MDDRRKLYPQPRSWEHVARQLEDENPHLTLTAAPAPLTPGRVTWRAHCRHCAAPLGKSYETPDVAACLAGLCSCEAGTYGEKTGPGPAALARLLGGGR